MPRKKSKFTEEQIAFALRQAEGGVKVEEVCRKLGIAEATFYVWKKKYGGLGVGELRRLRQLEEENRQLKKLVADLSLDKQMLQDVLRKKSEARQEAGHGGMAHRALPRECTEGVHGDRAVALDVPVPVAYQRRHAPAIADP